MFTNEKLRLIERKKEVNILQRKAYSIRTQNLNHTERYFVQSNELEDKKRNSFGDVRVHYNSNVVQKVQIPVIQFCREEKIATILRLCQKHGFTEVGEEYAGELYDSIKAGNGPRIGNHNAIIRKWGSGFRIEAAKFSGGGMMGRLDMDAGEDVSFKSGSHDFFSLPDSFTKSATVTKSLVTSVPPRVSLNPVMGGSAYDMTGIQDSEHLHYVGHQLIGNDTAENLMPGYHATNTAMIPIENLVHDVALEGVDVNYQVQFPPRVGFESLWVSDALINVSFSYAGKAHSNTWHIEVNSSEKMSKSSYDSLVGSVQDFRKMIFGK